MLESTNYDEFKILDFNRTLNRKHIEELKKSITQYGYLDSHPIVVNSDMEILDGQHRFKALREMGLPIKYEVVEDPDEKLIIELNTSQKKWTREDYINYYATKYGNPNYLRIARLSKSMNISPIEVITLGKCVSDGSNISRVIKTGKLKFTINEEMRCESNFKKIKDLTTSLRMKPSVRFMVGFMDLFKYSNFDYKIMLKKAQRYPTLAYNCRTAAEFTNMLKDIYNHDQRKAENRLA